MGEPLRLYGLNALVLNAADGIGEAIARTLVKHGATVVAADTANSGVEQHFRAVSGVTGQVAKLTDGDSLAKLVEDAAGQLGSLDIVVNDFLLRQDAPLSRVDDKLKAVLQQRASLIMAACRAALPHLERSEGSIINIASDWGLRAGERAAAYCASKAGLVLLTKAMARPIIAPMTTADKDYPTRIACRFKKKQGRIVLDQIRTIDKRRLVKRLGTIDPKTQSDVVSVLQGMFAF